MAKYTSLVRFVNGLAGQPKSSPVREGRRHIDSGVLNIYTLLSGFLCVARRSSRALLCLQAGTELAFLENRLKTLRHSAIRELLMTTAVANQDELRRKLAGRGINVTQATLSRDIRELKLLKGPAGYAPTRR